MPDQRDTQRYAKKRAKAANWPKKKRGAAFRRFRRKVRRIGDTVPNPGPDLSMWNVGIDWDKAAEHSDFVFLKASEGRSWEDPTLVERVDLARQAAQREGLIVGYYHFARPDNNPSRTEARHFVKTVREAGGYLGPQRRGLLRRDEMPGVLDYEVYHPTKKDEHWISEWVDEYEKITGHQPIIYGGHVLRERTTTNFGGCPLWLAAYVPELSPALLPEGWWKAGPTFWQYTDGKVPADPAGPAECPGVGPCDMNFYRGDRRHLLKLAI
jgi:lysozyme